MTKEIISLSIGPSLHDYEYSTEIFGISFRVRRHGADGDFNRVQARIADLGSQVDAIGLEGMQRCFRIGRRVFVHRQVQQLADTARSTPVVDGSRLRSTLDRWSVSRVLRDRPDLFRYKEILFLSGIHHYPLAQVLGRATDRLRFCDPIVHWTVPIALNSLPQLEKYANWLMPLLCRLPIHRMNPIRPGAGITSDRIARLVKSADVVVGNTAFLQHFDQRQLRHKTIVTNSLAEEQIEALREKGASSVINLSPAFDRKRPYVDASVLEAAFACLIDSEDAGFSDDDFLSLVSRWEGEPRVFSLNQPPEVAKFAFVIHPLSISHIFNHPILRHLRFVPHWIVERSVANLPPLYLSRITGIRSTATGKEVEGYLISLGATPREFLRRKPGFTYRRLIVASRMAQRMGATIMGLGAFTKVVGDAGITVGQKADIAITSGNSLTVAATLEAAKMAVVKMGAQDLTRGRAMIIGATGSIGAVSSRLLAQAILDVILVAPRPERLIELKRTIEKETPGARVVISTNAAPYLPVADLVVTTTTAIGEKVIDVRRLKPGCVVCDVARPPDVKEEDALLRPDVLVIESGEVLLPGEPNFGFNIGLPPGVAYACLAETALLALEGRFENFTLGRNIEMDRVKEIYRLFKKHGLELEGLRSFGRYVSDQEIEAKRALADELRQDPLRLEALLNHAETTAVTRLQPAVETVRRLGTPRTATVLAAAIGGAAMVVAVVKRRRFA